MLALKLTMDSEAEDLSRAFMHEPSDTDEELRALKRESQEYKETMVRDVELEWHKNPAKSGSV